jgi:Flp pilus assembly pilin Flp
VLSHDLRQRGFRVTRTLERILREDDGQDLIEYALLCALIGIVGILAWTNVGTAINGTYGGWDGAVQSLSATMPDPAGS